MFYLVHLTTNSCSWWLIVYFQNPVCFLILFLDTIVRFPSFLANRSTTMAFLLLLKFTFVSSVLSGSLFTLLLIEGVSF